MRCLKCDYLLNNLAEHRCPECGTEFDPKVRATYSMGKRENLAANWLRFGLIALCGYLLVFAVVFMYFRGSGATNAANWRVDAVLALIWAFPVTPCGIVVTLLLLGVVAAIIPRKRL